MEIRVTRPVIDPKSLNSLILTHYNLKEPLEVRILHLGDNDHYLVKARDDTYVLRIYRHSKHWLQKKSNYLFELEWLLFLYNHGIPVSYPIPQNHSEYLGKIEAPEGLRYFALFNYAPGHLMKFDREHCYYYGKMISKIHSISNSFSSSHERSALDLHFLLKQPLIRISDYLKNKRDEDIRYLRELTPILCERIQEMTQAFESDEWGIIGGDFHGLNHLCTSNCNATFLDFDLCGPGWRAYDLAVFKWSLFDIYQGGKKSDDCQVLWEAFLNGYTVHRHLTQAEKDLIPLFVQARQIWLMGSETTYSDRYLDEKYWDEMLFGLKIAQKLYKNSPT